MLGWFKSKTHPIQEKVFHEPQENFLNPEKILDTFTTLTGIHFKQKESITASKLSNFCRKRDIFSFDLLSSRLQADSLLLEELINFLTVNETYFFREVGQMNFMACRASETKEGIRILCAPGSTGEEPYSIAITLLEQGIAPELIRIVSLDINSEAAVKGREGSYAPRAFHKTSPEIQERYFIPDNGRFTVREEVKRLVSFHTVNIFHEQLFELGTFDYLFSRNMLIYFDIPTAHRAIGRLKKLAKGETSLFFFGHADIVGSLPLLREHYEQGIKFYTL